MLFLQYKNYIFDLRYLVTLYEAFKPAYKVPKQRSIYKFLTYYLSFRV